jgi:GR25 family glycosyltransferase involved in LPS biosynthesis
MNNLLDDLVGKNNWKAYCINLERSKDRRESFFKWAETINLDFSFFKATDKLDLKKEELYVYVNNKISNGATACSMSHIKLYKYLLDTYKCEYFLILEDDCGFEKSNKNELFIFLKNIKNIQRYIKWSYIWFGYHYCGYNHRLGIFKEVDYILHTHMAHCFLASRNVLQHVLNIYESYKNLPIDWIHDIDRKCFITLGPKDTIVGTTSNESVIWG